MADYVVSAELELFINDFKKNITVAQNSLQNFEKQVKSVSESTKNGFDGKSISNFSSKLESLGSKINKGTSAWGLDLGKFYDKGSSIFKSFGVDVDKFAGHFGMSGKLMSAIVACFRALIKLGQEMDEARAEIVKGTGAIGDALDSLELSSKQALIRGVGTSVKETGKLIADLNTRFDMTGKVLEDTAVEFGKFIKVTGVDMSNAVNNIADVMARWNVSTNQTKNLMNQLTKASQMSGASVDELVSSVNSGSVYMEQFGFSLTESIAILGSFRKNGIQASTVLTGMRTALAKFSSEGKNAKEAFAEVSTQIKEAATDTEAMQIAVDTFGQRSAPEMVKAIRSGSMSVDEFSDALRNAGQSLDNTYDAVRTSKDAMTDLKNSFKGTFGGIGEGFSAWWKRILNGITEFIRFIEPIVTPIAEVFRSVMTKISEAITYVVRHIRQFVQENSVRWKAFVEVLNRVGQAVKRICGDIVDIFKHVFGLIFSLLGGKWEEATLHAKIIGLKFVRVIQTILDFVINLFIKAINKIGDLINKGWVNWYMFTTDLYKNTGGIVDITGSGKHFSDAKKEFEERFEGWANKDEMVKEGMELYIKKVMEDSGTRFKDLEEVHLEDNKFGKENKSVNERIEEAEKRLAELEGKGDYIGDLGDVTLTFQEQSLDAIGGSGADKKESTEWQKKRLQQQLDDITKLKEEQLEAMREEGAAQAELDAVNSTYAQKQIEVYEKIQALKKAGDLEALESVKNAEDEKLQLEEYYAKESEDYRISVETNTVKAIEKIEKESTEWKQKLLNQEIDAIETARTDRLRDTGNTEKVHRRTGGEIQGAVRLEKKGRP